MIKYPFGKAEVLTATPAASVAVTISNQMTYVKFSAALSAATTITFTLSEVSDGALVFVELPCTTAFDTTFGSSTATSAGVTGTTNKTKVASFVLVSGKLVHTGTSTIN